MARGWESKGVEAQQEAAVHPQSKAQKITAEDMARRAERATLSLARTRALADLQKACAAAHRAMLEQAIADLDKRLAALENPKPQIPNPKSQ
jgi:GR25 family glycosyltransferase involved in LPS biosynthesis